jgi:hypothetical protein
VEAFLATCLVVGKNPDGLEESHTSSLPLANPPVRCCDVMISKVTVELKPDGLRPGVIQSAIYTRITQGPTDLYQRRLVLQPMPKTRLILHYAHLRTGSHKLELVGGDAMTFKEIFQAMSVVAFAEAEQLRVMRIDASADVVGRSIHWFREHLRVPYKRFHTAYGSVRSGRRGFQPETMYYGRGEDVLRIYDKAEQLRHSEKFDCPRFTRWPDGAIPCHLVRFERQFRGRAVPEELKHLGGLFNAHRINPFENVRLEPFQALDFGDAPIRAVLASQALAWHIEKHGQQAMICQFNKWSKGNGRRIMRSLSRHATRTDGIGLYQIFRAEVLAQMERAQ